MPRIDGEKIRPGPIGSLLLHGLVAFFLLYRASTHTEPLPPPQIFPVDLVVLSENGTGPVRQQNAAGPAALKQPAPARAAPRQASGTERAAPDIKPGPTPTETAPPEDALQKKLEALSRLRQPDADSSSPDRAGLASLDAAGNGGKGGTGTGYSVKDFIRAQVEQRWNIDLGPLKDRTVTVSIRIRMEANGAITKAEIVDSPRFHNDAVYHSLALSARNAVLLSSPLSLPGGSTAAATDLTLDLSPRDLVR